MCPGHLSEAALRMRRSACLATPQWQGGSMLLEAMVGILLSAVLGLGMAYSAARALNAQRYASIQNLAVMDMRVSLATSSACVAGAVAAASGAASGALASLSYTQTCSTLTPTISAAGAIATTSLSRTESLATSTSAASTGLFGGDGVIRFGP